MEKLNITLLGPAHPYRGGLAIIMQTMARVFQRDGHRVDLKTFTVQYPQWLFPGKSQFVDTPAPDDLRIERCVSTVNPFNWLRMGLRIRRERPDIVLLKYWTPSWPLLRNDSPPGPPQRAHPFPVSDRQRGAP